MNLGIINIGDELLIGQTINTNASWLGKTFGDAGINVIQSATIEDDGEAIIETLNNYIKKLDIVIITGGLGPTNDDLTKEILTDYFETELVLDPVALKQVEKIIKKKGKDLLEANIQQAYLPKDALILKNTVGTASGMWFERKGKIVISLPGVPYEMKSIIENEVLPKLQSRFDLVGKYYETAMVQGIGESTLAAKIKNWEEKAAKDGLHLAYLPSPGLIKLRLNSSRGKKDASLIQSYFEELRKKLPKYVYALKEEEIYKTVGELLKKNGKTLSTIESCTGGNIAHSFINYPGASQFFVGGLITYSNLMKQKLVGVPKELLEKHGAVSKEVAEAMAEGGRKKLGTDYTIAVTGIAGPEGGTKNKPVGTVWISIGTAKKVYTHCFQLGDNRDRNIQRASLYAANFLRQIILEINSFSD